MSLAAPYRFIPVSDFVLFPDWASQVSHDVPFEDGFCGEINYSIINQTRLCVGGERIKFNEDSATTVKFYRTPQNELAIPGTSLKGAIRDVLKIATFGKFDQVANTRFGMRDLDNDYYKKAIVKGTNAGLMFHENGKWSIRPCEFIRVEMTHLRSIDINITDSGSIDRRYNEVNGHNQTIKFNAGSKTITPKNGRPFQQATAIDLNSGTLLGRIVVTGAIPGKQNEFLFYKSEHSKQNSLLDISSNVLDDFKLAHQNHEVWQYWQESKRLADGIPVFYHLDDDGLIKTMGLSLMYKIAYKNSIGDLIKNNLPNHVKNALDMCDLILGYVDESEKSGKNNIRGRVNFSHALLQGQCATKQSEDLVLAQPKATFYNAYLTQKSDDLQHYMLNDATPAGWKRYPVKEESICRVKMKEDNDNDNSAASESNLETVGAGNCFEGKITFHNLKAIELGALLWVLDFGSRKECKHSLGTGKPFGFGQVNIEVTKLVAEANAVEVQDVRSYCQNAFDCYMNNTNKQVEPNDDWQDNQQIKLLLMMTDPKYQYGMKLDYFPNIENFSKAKKEKSTFPLPSEMILVAEQKIAKQARNAERQMLEQAQVNASPLESAIIELEFFANDVEAWSNKTRIDKTRKELKFILDNLTDLNEDHKPRLSTILVWAESGNKDKVIKVVKQLRKALS